MMLFYPTVIDHIESKHPYKASVVREIIRKIDAQLPKEFHTAVANDLDYPGYPCPFSNSTNEEKPQ